MIAYPPSLKAIGGARSGIAPVNLLDVQDVNGNLYYWSDRPSNAPVVITGGLPGYAYPPIPPTSSEKVAWAYPTIGGVSGEGDFYDTGSMSESGSIKTCFFQAEGAHLFSWATFSGFKMPTLPSDAVITRIWPTVICNVDVSGGGELITSTVCNFPSGGSFAGEYHATNALWTQLSGLTPEQAIEAFSWMPVELGENRASCFATISFIGVAIYYTSESGGYAGWGFPGEAPYGSGPYIPWLVEVPKFTFHRSLVTDVGAFVLQNLSGDSLSRNFEKIARRSTLEGAFFVFRSWQADAEAAWLEVHGTLTVDPIGVDTVTLKGTQLLNPSQDDTPLEIYSETCQLQWGGPRCGATGSTECQYSYQTCQVPAHIMVEANSYEKNYGDTVANTAFNIINRRRTI